MILMLTGVFECSSLVRTVDADVRSDTTCGRNTDGEEFIRPGFPLRFSPLFDMDMTHLYKIILYQLKYTLIRINP